MKKKKQQVQRKIVLKILQIQQKINRPNDQQKSRKSVVVLGDSMTKQLNGWEMLKRITTNCKIYVEIFSGATPTCIDDYMKPSLQVSSDHFILHIGRNDLISRISSRKSSIQ